MGMAAATVVPGFAGSELVPRLRRVQHRAVSVERLKRKRGVGGNAGHEARIGVAIGILGLTSGGWRPRLSCAEFTNGNLAEDAQAFLGVVVEQPTVARVA